MPPSGGRQHTATPVVRAVEWAADFVRPLQSGDVNLYLLYVFVAALAAYLIAAL
jgi:hydrogenase-4 component B